MSEINNKKITNDILRLFVGFQARVIRPNTIVTAEFIEKRLNIYLDEKSNIIKLDWG